MSIDRRDYDVRCDPRFYSLVGHYKDNPQDLKNTTYNEKSQEFIERAILQAYEVFHLQQNPYTTSLITTEINAAFKQAQTTFDDFDDAAIDGDIDPAWDQKVEELREAFDNVVANHREFQGVLSADYAHDNTIVGGLDQHKEAFEKTMLSQWLKISTQSTAHVLEDILFKTIDQYVQNDTSTISDDAKYDAIHKKLKEYKYEGKSFDYNKIGEIPYAELSTALTQIINTIMENKGDPFREMLKKNIQEANLLEVNIVKADQLDSKKAEVLQAEFQALNDEITPLLYEDDDENQLAQEAEFIENAVKSLDETKKKLQTSSTETTLAELTDLQERLLDLSLVYDTVNQKRQIIPGKSAEFQNSYVEIISASKEDITTLTFDTAKDKLRHSQENITVLKDSIADINDRLKDLNKKAELKESFSSIQNEFSTFQAKSNIGLIFDSIIANLDTTLVEKEKKFFEYGRKDKVDSIKAARDFVIDNRTAIIEQIYKDLLANPVKQENLIMKINNVVISYNEENSIQKNLDKPRHSFVIGRSNLHDKLNAHNSNMSISSECKATLESLGANIDILRKSQPQSTPSHKVEIESTTVKDMSANETPRSFSRRSI